MDVNAIPVIAIICSTIVAIFWMISRSSQKAKKPTPANDQQILNRLDKLEDHIKNKVENRIANLESILTDREYELTKKFNDL